MSFFPTDPSSSLYNFSKSSLKCKWCAFKSILFGAGVKRLAWSTDDEKIIGLNPASDNLFREPAIVKFILKFVQSKSSGKRIEN